MKKLVTVSLFIFFVISCSIIITGLVFYQNNNLNSSNSQVLNNNVTTGTVGSLTLDFAEVSKHNTSSDCWMIVNGKIYNLTKFASSHSGGANTIIPYCGKDGTRAYDTKDGRGPHASGDVNILSNYYVGDLNQKVDQGIVNQNVQKANTVAPVRSNDDEYEGYDD